MGRFRDQAWVTSAGLMCPGRELDCVDEEPSPCPARGAPGSVWQELIGNVFRVP